MKKFTAKSKGIVFFLKVILFSEKRIYYGFTIQDWYSQYRTHTVKSKKGRNIYCLIKVSDGKTDSRGNCESVS